MDISVPCPREGCGGSVPFELEIEPGDPNYGADADGNRGISIPDSYVRGSDCPDECSEGCVFTLKEKELIEEQADTKASEQESPEQDYEEYDGRDDYDKRYYPDIHDV